VVTPDPHPDPPGDLQHRKLPLIEATGPWVRSHALHHGPIFFGRTGVNRFDAPSDQYGVLYVAEDIQGAFIETFGRQLGIHEIPIARIAARTFSQVLQSRPLRLVDLIGPGLSRIGADNRLTAASYDPSQRWSLVLHEHPDHPDGLLYRSRHDPSRLCAAIFDRAAGALTATSLGSLADASNAALLANLLDTYEYSLIV
jgi:hypothetical protein